MEVCPVGTALIHPDRPTDMSEFFLKRSSVSPLQMSYYRGSDKSLARPGRKQATATKLARRLTCFLLSLCIKKRLAILHMNRTFFPKTLSIPSYDIGK
jgi:hypothetical protein